MFVVVGEVSGGRDEILLALFQMKIELENRLAQATDKLLIDFEGDSTLTQYLWDAAATSSNNRQTGCLCLWDNKSAGLLPNTWNDSYIREM